MNPVQVADEGIDAFVELDAYAGGGVGVVVLYWYMVWAHIGASVRYGRGVGTYEGTQVGACMCGTGIVVHCLHRATAGSVQVWHTQVLAYAHVGSTHSHRWDRGKIASISCSSTTMVAPALPLVNHNPCPPPIQNMTSVCSYWGSYQRCRKIGQIERMIARPHFMMQLQLLKSEEPH